MYMACIGGWDNVQAFSDDKEKAKQLALNEKRKLCKDDLEKWTWAECEEYYGAWVVELHESLVLYDNREL